MVCGEPCPHHNVGLINHSVLSCRCILAFHTAWMLPGCQEAAVCLGSCRNAAAARTGGRSRRHSASSCQQPQSKASLYTACIYAADKRCRQEHVPLMLLAVNHAARKGLQACCLTNMRHALYCLLQPYSRDYSIILSFATVACWPGKCYSQISYLRSRHLNGLSQLPGRTNFFSMYCKAIYVLTGPLTAVLHKNTPLLKMHLQA